MSRHFYLPKQQSRRSIRAATERIGAVPVWLRITVLSVALLVVAWYVWDEFHSAPVSTGSGMRSVPQSAATEGSGERDLQGDRREQYSDTANTTETKPATSTSVSNIKHPVRLQVLNGCGVKGLAKLISPGLREKGFDVRETRNAGSFRYSYSMVMDRIGNLDLAMSVADSLGIDRSRVKTEIARNLVDIDVTLVVGADYESLRLNLKQ